MLLSRFSSVLLGERPAAAAAKPYAACGCWVRSSSSSCECPENPEDVGECQAEKKCQTEQPKRPLDKFIEIVGTQKLDDSHCYNQHHGA